MVKNIIEHNEKVLPNDREMKALKEYFPSCFEGDSFDIEKFKDLINSKLNIQKEGYELKFLGKNYARLLASLDTTTVIVPDEENNIKEENTNSENIYISGDNIDALKHLLNSYYHKIKCIYIDPPYNTGSDGFVYNDNFTFTSQELSSKLSIDEEEARRILDLTKRGSASHSAWLMFMYPRLMLARDLLTDDGVIFISIDDNEQANLKLICDEIFGEENCLGCICRSTGQTTGQDSGGLGSSFDYAFVYSRHSDIDIEGLPLSEHDKKRFEFEDDNGKYAIDQLRKTGSNDRREDRPNMYYPVKDPDGNDVFPIAAAGYHSCWRVERKKYNQLLNEGTIVWKKTKRNNEEIWWPYVKYYLEGRSKRPSPLWTELEGNKKATRELRDIFDGTKIFDYVKPLDFLKKILQITPNLEKGDIVLDFFSGSATTAHALMELENGCKFIMVQIPAELDENIPIQKAAKDFLNKENLPQTLDQIGMERIRRAARKIKEKNPNTKADLGFKHYTLKEPTTLVLDKLEKFNPNEKNLFEENDILSEFGNETVLETWLVQDGYGFTAKPEIIDLASYKGYYIGKHVYLLDKELTQDAIASLTTKIETDPSFNPETIALFGYSFTWTELEDLKINLARPKATEKNLNVNIDVRY